MEHSRRSDLSFVARRNRAVLLPAVVLLVALHTFSGTAQASSVADVKARGKLVMLCFPHQESTFIRVKTEVDLHHYDGIDYEIMEGFARSLGVTLEVKAVKPSFAALIPGLLRGDGDIIASSFSITPERSKKVEFSQPYFNVHTVVIAAKSAGFQGPESVKGKTGSTVRGSSQEEKMKQLSPGRVHYVDFTRWNYDALMDKDADFTVLDDTSTWRLLQLYPDLAVAFELPGVDSYGFAVAPHSDLRESLDRYLDTIKSNGTLDEIVRRYLGDKGTSGVPKG